MPKETERPISDYQKKRISAQSGYPESWIEIMYPTYYGSTYEIVGLLDKKPAPSKKDLDDCAELMAIKLINVLNSRGRVLKNRLQNTPEWKNSKNILDNMQHAHQIFYEKLNERITRFNGVITPNTAKNKSELHETTIVKKTTEPFFGYSWNGDGYENISLDKMSDDYHENNENYTFRICRLGRDSGDSMGRAKGYPEKINYLAKTLALYHKGREKSNWKPIVFAIIAKSSSSHEPIIRILGKINRKVKRSSNGFSNQRFYFEHICWFEREDKPKSDISVKVSNRDYLIASQSQKDLNAYDFLKLFEDLERESKQPSYEKHSSIMSNLKNKERIETEAQKIPDEISSLAPDGTSLGDGNIDVDDDSEKQEESTVDKFKNISNTAEELGIKDETEDDDIDDYDSEQREKEILAEPIRKLSPEMEKKIEKCTNKLCIDDTYIRQIIHHLASGRHVLIGGAIGTGKSHFVREFLGKFWATDKSPKGYNVQFNTATDEWSTVDVIGGIMPDTEKEELRYKFQDGCLTKTVQDCTVSLQFPKKGYQGDWLAIDEFNRADIEKAFGQLFTAIEDEELKIPGRTIGRNHKLEQRIKIPKQFRIIGMMNTSDKHFLYPIHDALKRRFAYVEIMPPTRAEREKEIKAARQNASDAIYPSGILPIGIDENKELENRINSAYELLAGIRTVKGLGTAILKAIIQELISAMDSDQRVYTKVSISAGNDPDEILDWSLTANLLPQFQGIKTETLLIFERMFVYANAKTPQDLFSEITTDPEKIEEFSEGWKMFVQTITDDAPETNNEYDLKSQIEKMNQYTEMWDRKKEKLGFDPNSQFAKKLRIMIESGD